MIVACDDDFNEYQRVEANFMPNGNLFLIF